MTSNSITAKLQEIISIIPNDDINLNGLDVSWMETCKDEELNQFFDWMTDSITTDNYITKEELLLADRLKHQESFLVSENEVNDILKELNYTYIPLNDVDNELIRSKLKDIDDNIVAVTALHELVNSEYKYINNDVEQLEQDLQDKKRKLSYLLADYKSDIFKLNMLFSDIATNYHTYLEILEHNFFSKTSAKNFLVLMSSYELNYQHELFNEKVTKYINSCHNYSSIPLHKSNTSNHHVTTSCDSTFCSFGSSDSEIISNPICIELSMISSSLKKKYLTKHLLEATLHGLILRLSKLNEMNNSVATLWSDIVEWYSIRTMSPQRLFDTDSVEIESDIRHESDKWVEFQIALVLISIMKDKIAARVEKMNVLSKFSDIINRNKGIVDLHWITITMEQELLEIILFEFLNSGLTGELEDCKKRKDYMKLILAQPEHSTIEPMSSINCLQKLLPQNFPSSCTLMDNISKFLDSIEDAERAFLQSLNNFKTDLIERCKENDIIKNILFDGPTRKLNFINNNHVMSKINSAEIQIESLRHKIEDTSSKHDKLY